MKILHVTPHLGGGVGKAHAAINAALSEAAEQTFVLLEPPRDRSHVAVLVAAGARVIVADHLDQVAALARDADIVQFEFWNHPRLFECLARCEFPAMRSVFWAHISGLSRPFIQPELMQGADRFVATSEASFSVPWLAALRETAPRKFSSINSGFGFAGAARQPNADRAAAIAYLGTVDFVKMHPGFFDIADRLDGDDIRVSVWGEPDEAVIARAKSMRHPGRIRFRGQTADSAAALAEADIFLYPLQPDHYGTAENALVEAMSLGLVPVVLNNRAEKAIVRHGETGFVEHAIGDCTAKLQMLLAQPQLRERMARAAVRHVAENLTPSQSALKFMELWRGLLGEPKKINDFRAVIGDAPADWFLATQSLPGPAWLPPSWQTTERAAKGTLAHFDSIFPGDPSLALLRRSGAAHGWERRPLSRERIRA
jgi:glycosyltransferase involved in cell wall biosynthesis